LGRVGDPPVPGGAGSVRGAGVSPAPAADRQRPPLEDVIRTTMENAIEAYGGSIPRAAAALEVSPSTIYRRIEAWRAGEKTE